MSEKQNPLVVVIDIETLGTAIDSVIATIGAVIVNIFTGEIVSRFYIRCKTEYQANRTHSSDTMAWWLKQEEAPYLEVFNEKLHRFHLHLALNMLNDFIIDHIPERPQIFGNGPEFDNALLEHAMKQENIQPAWDHGCNQSLRTMVFIGRQLLNYDPKKTLPFKGVPHHALNDAEHEAQYLCSIISKLTQALKTNHSLPDMDNKNDD